MRRTYLLHQENIQTALLIWPCRDSYTLQDLEFASECRRIMGESEAALTSALSPLAVLKNVREDNLLIQTLAVYLLDAGSSVTSCAELLFLHKNTVKYRLNRIRELLRHPIDKMPELSYLYRSVALHRLTAHK